MADNVPPITSSNIISGWHQVDFFVAQLSAIDYADTVFDTPSGVKRTYYKFYPQGDPEPAYEINENTENLANFITTFNILGQGNFVVKYYSEDNNGNIESVKTKLP